MPEKVLLVDDDPHLLSALRRQLGEHFELTTAEGGEAAIAAVQAAGIAHAPFAVVLCDMRMPGLNGIETLAKIRDIAPDTVRIMLTGNADQQTAIAAINHGNIFRFYSKPCPSDELRDGLTAGVEQYRLVMAERDLLEKTLAGSLKVLMELVSMNDPAGYQFAMRLRDWVRGVAEECRIPQRWQVEIAATLVGIGQVTIPPEILAKHYNNEPLTEIEHSIVERAPESARNLVANIPRMEKVAEMLLYQDKGFDGSGFPSDGKTGEAIPLGGRLLKILKDLAQATSGGPLTRAAFAVLDKHAGLYDSRLLGQVRMSLESAVSVGAPIIAELPLSALRVGQLILSDIRLTNGHLILAANTQISEPQIERLRNLRKMFPFVEPIKVRV
jgi:response regulator RpfG family c-di-GMP phosphodiesterase